MTALTVLPRLLRGLAILGDGPADNVADNARRVPKPGIELAPEVRRDLEKDLAALQASIAELNLRSDGTTHALLPDVQIHARAVESALRYGEFWKEDEVKKARDLLREGGERAAQLRAGSAPWASQTGLVVRGYVSRI